MFISWAACGSIQTHADCVMPSSSDSDAEGATVRIVAPSNWKPDVPMTPSAKFQTRSAANQSLAATDVSSSAFQRQFAAEDPHWDT